MTDRQHVLENSGLAKQNIVEEKNSKTDQVIRKYLKGKFLGKGGFAKVYEFTNLETKKVWAAKLIQKSSLIKTRAKQKLMSEIKIHKSLHNTNIVRFESVFEDKEYVYIILEVCTNQTMNELIRRRKRLTELEVQCYLMQLLSGMQYLHQNRVIHRDLKLGNLFLNEKMEIKIGDLGLAAKLDFDGEKKKTVCGTPNYIAPEILENKGGHSYEVDIWSFGVIFYTLLIGKPPFETSDVKATYRKIKMNQYTFPEHIIVSENAKSLIKKILHLDPTKRPTIEEILSEPFFQTGGIPKTLPVSTLACPPSAQYLRQFATIKDLSSQNLNQLKASPKKFDNTTPVPINAHSHINDKKQFNNTERISAEQGATKMQKLQYDLNNVNNQNILLDKNSALRSSQENKLLAFGGNQIGNIVQSNVLSEQNKIQNNYASGLQRQHTCENNQLIGQQNKQGFENLLSNELLESRIKMGPEIWITKFIDYSQKYGIGKFHY